MRKSILTLLGLGAFAAANAAPITFTDVVDPADVFLSKSGTGTFSYTHSILDEGFDPARDLVLGARLFISLADDGDNQAENVRISLDNVTISQSFHVTTGAHQFLVNSALLQADGQVLVNLKVLAGDFYFQSSRLEVGADRPEAVPEPATLAMMGLGLLGLGAAYRRRKA